MQNVLNHVSDRSSLLTGKRRKNIKNFQRSVRGGYYTALSCDDFHDVGLLVCIKYQLSLIDPTDRIVL